MEMEIVQVVSQVGFPIAVAVYALVKLDNTMRGVEKMLTKIYEKLDLGMEGK